MNKNKKIKAKLRILQKIKNIIYGELEAYTDQALPDWFQDCVNHIAVDIAGFMLQQKDNVRRSTKEVTIFKGKVKPGIGYVGQRRQPNVIEDKFGELWLGQVRTFLINTRWGQLHASSTFGGKDIEIIVRETKEEK
jgi:hypothetical protein